MDGLIEHDSGSDGNLHSALVGIIVSALALFLFWRHRTNFAGLGKF